MAATTNPLSIAFLNVMFVIGLRWVVMVRNDHKFAMTLQSENHYLQRLRRRHHSTTTTTIIIIITTGSRS